MRLACAPAPCVCAAQARKVRPAATLASTSDGKSNSRSYGRVRLLQLGVGTALRGSSRFLYSTLLELSRHAVGHTDSMKCTAPLAFFRQVYLAQPSDSWSPQRGPWI
jgi:hypothetical protein